MLRSRIIREISRINLRKKNRLDQITLANSKTIRRDDFNKLNKLNRKFRFLQPIARKAPTRMEKIRNLRKIDGTNLNGSLKPQLSLLQQIVSKEILPRNLKLVMKSPIRVNRAKVELPS